MSFGHGQKHTTREGERMYNKAMNDPRFQALRHRPFRISFDYDIPYLGGYNQEGSMIYIDKDTPAQLKRGKRVYQVMPPGGAQIADQVFNTSEQLGPYLVRGIVLHEHWEKTAMQAWGWGYDESHELATHAENHFAREVLQMDPSEYEELWQPVIHLAERKLHAQAIQLPPDLDRTPYQ